jgi:hypothetical protein
MHRTSGVLSAILLCGYTLHSLAQSQPDNNKLIATAVAINVVPIVTGIDYCSLQQPSSRSPNVAAYEKLRSENSDLIRKYEVSPEYLAMLNAMKQKLSTLTPPQQQEMARFCAKLPELISGASSRLGKIRAALPKQ